MNDDKTVESYRIQGGSVLHLVLALREVNNLVQQLFLYFLKVFFFVFFLPVNNKVQKND